MMNSGYANQIAVESSKMYDFYLKEGFFRDRLTLTGSLADDLQYTRLKDQKRLKSELCKELAIDQTKPIILVAAPPNQLASGDRRGFEFDSLKTSLKAVFQALHNHSKNFNIVVRPHPSHMELDDCLIGTSCKKTSIDTALLIPLCDFYVAFASATIRWAITARKASFNYDIFRYDYEDYKFEPAVISVNSLKGFELHLDNLCSNREYVTSLKRTQQECAKNGACWTDYVNID